MLDTGQLSSCGIAGGRRAYKPPCKLVATLGHFRYGDNELEAWGVGIRKHLKRCFIPLIFTEHLSGAVQFPVFLGLILVGL